MCDRGHRHVRISPEIHLNLTSPDPDRVCGLSRVRIRNDDVTPAVFVMNTLETVFDMPRLDAAGIALRAHFLGSAVCGDYTSEVAEAKVAQVIGLARQEGHPLMCSVEQE
jgi:ATP-dependent Clp protease adaptor protein ClpS